jgi:outer membrane immunogenic protein
MAKNRFERNTIASRLVWGYLEMNKLLLTGAALVVFPIAALAADLTSRIAPDPTVAAVPAFTWTGFYVGAQAGYVWSETSTRMFFDGTSVNLDSAAGPSGDGLIGGAHAGFNYQFGSVVVGGEGDLEAAGINGNIRFVDPFNDQPDDSLNVETQINFQGSIRARLGFAFDRALIYATGGVAFASVENTYTFTFDPAVPISDDRENFDNTEWGWTLGAGIEYAFMPNLMGRIEYRYTKFDNVKNASEIYRNPLFENDVEQHTLRAGVSYKFGPY